MKRNGYTAERAREALTRATTGQTFSNYPAIFEGFLAKGLPESEIQPRVNIFTYEAWRAQGRQVCKGEHGVKVLTYITHDVASKDPEDTNPDGTVKTRVARRPWTTTVFHVSQTKAIEQAATGHEPCEACETGRKHLTCFVGNAKPQ